KNTENAIPWSTRTSARPAMLFVIVASSVDSSSSPTPTRRNGRRPSASTHGPTSGWHTMPTALYQPITTPMSTSVPPRRWVKSGSNTKTLKLRKKKKFVTVARRNGCCDRIAGTSDYRMGATHAALAGGLQRRGDDFILTIDPAFQGLPETAHGGTVLAAFHLAS